MWIRLPGPLAGRTTHWQRMADARPHSRCAWTRAHGLGMSMTRSPGRSGHRLRVGQQRPVDAVPSHELSGFGCHPMQPKASGQQPHQRGDPGAAGPVRLRADQLTADDRDLVP